MLAGLNVPWCADHWKEENEFCSCEAKILVPRTSKAGEGGGHREDDGRHPPSVVGRAA